MKQNKAYTLAEVLITLMIWAFVAVLTLIVFSGADDYIKKIKFKNVSLEFENGLKAVITNPYYYSLNGDLASLDDFNTRTGERI